MRTVEHIREYNSFYCFLMELHEMRERMIGDRDDTFIEIIPAIGEDKYVITVKISK